MVEQDAAPQQGKMRSMILPGYGFGYSRTRITINSQSISGRDPVRFLCRGNDDVLLLHCLGLKCPTYWVGRLCKNNSHTRKYRINVKCEMRNKCVSLGNATYIQHKCKINTFYEDPRDLPICIGFAFMLCICCMSERNTFIVHFTFHIYSVFPSVQIVFAKPANPIGWTLQHLTLA